MKVNIRIPLLIFTLLKFAPCGFSQAPFNHCKFLEEFFSTINFKNIPYFEPSVRKPYIPLSDARDSLIEVIDYNTYESRLINEKELVAKSWKKYNHVQQFVKNRQIEENSFHLISTKVNLRDLSYIKSVLANRIDENLIDTSQLNVIKSLEVCKIFNSYNNENFLFKRSIDNLSDEQKYNMRGYFRFGPILKTSDNNYAIVTYDIYHKWISSKGERTDMETGGGGILIVNLKNEQKIKKILYCWDY